MKIPTLQLNHNQKSDNSKENKGDRVFERRQTTPNRPLGINAVKEVQQKLDRNSGNMLIAENKRPGTGPVMIKESLEESTMVKFDQVDDLSGQYAWVARGDEMHLTAVPTHEELDPAFYDVIVTYQGWYLQRKKLYLDELYRLPNNITKDIVDDIEKFWTRKDKYLEHGITYKRGYLMYGEPGCGKTSLINFLVHEITKKHNGLVFNYSDGCIDIIKYIRSIEPNKPIMVIMEDIDALLNYSSHQVLQLLDGNSQVDNIIFFSTTNYPQRIEPRFINRPSRFDRVFEFPMPDEQVRRFFIERKLSESELDGINIDQWVRDTDGMSLSHLKELIVSVIVMDRDYSLAIQQLKTMNGAQFM